MAATCGTPAVLTLTLGGYTLDLMDADNGFLIGEVDLGYPNVREDISPIPDRDGAWDDTLWFGQRVVSIRGTMMAGTPAGSRSRVYDSLAPFLVPAVRPVLTVAIDADVAPRTITLRASQLSAPANEIMASDFQAQWVSADPALYSAQANETVVAPAGLGYGRHYTDPPDTGTVTNTSQWKPNRRYPLMAGTVSAIATNAGTLNVSPVVQIFGPCSNPAIYNDTVGTRFQVGSSANPFSLAAGEVVTVDARQRIVYLGTDPTNSRYSYVDFATSTWPVLVPGQNVIRYVPDTAQATSYATVTWNDAYL